MYFPLIHALTVPQLNEKHMVKGQLFSFLYLMTELIIFISDMNCPCHIKNKSKHRQQN